MSVDEDNLTRYELVKAKTAYIKQLEKELDKGKDNTNQIEFLKEYIVDLRKEVKEKSNFTLEEAIEELGFCYDVGTRIRHIIAGYISEAETKDYKPYHNMYLAWHLSVYFVFLNCKDISSHYIAIFQNAFNRNSSKISTLKEQADLIMGKSPMKPDDDFSSINFGIDKLEELIFRLEEKQNLLARQEIAKQEHEASTKYELHYSTSRKLTLNGILLATPDFMSENDQFLNFIFKDGNSWRTIPTSELLDALKVDKLGKTIHQILSDLNITGIIKEVFMPNVSSKGFEFRNPISYGFADENGLPTIDLKTIRNNKK
jgi:hypothetical protein